MLFSVSSRELQYNSNYKLTVDNHDKIFKHDKRDNRENTPKEWQGLWYAW